MHDLLNKTLILRLSSIGDIVLASPLIRVLRKRFPQSRIDFVVKSEYSELVRYNPHLTSVYEFSPAGGFPSLRSLKRRLKSVGYDSVIDIHNNLRSVYLRMLPGVGRHLTVDKRFFRRLMLVRFKRNYYGEPVSVADRYIEPLKYLGLENDNCGPELFIPPDVKEKIEGFWLRQGVDPGKRIIALVHGAKHNTKMWPADRFAELGGRITGDGDIVLLLGGPDEESRSAVIREKISAHGRGSAQVIDCTARMSLLETAALFDRCSAVVTNDSGLMHIASARKRPVLAIFGPTVREFGFFPVGTRSIVIEQSDLACRPCSYHGGRQCPKGHFLCMNDITVDRVYQSLQMLLTAS